MPRFVHCLIGLTLAACLTPFAHADTVTLTNHDTLTGKLIKRNKKTITFQDPILGKITIPKNKIASLQITAKKSNPASKPQTKSKSKSESNSAPASNTTTEAQAAKSPAKLNQNTGLFADPFFQGWKSELALGFSGSEGNTNNQAFHAAFKTKKETKKIRWLFDSKYFYTADHNQTAQNQLTAELTHDWLLPNSPWFYFLNGRYEYDQFENWKSRISGFAGVGYTFIKHKDLEVLGRLGFGATKDLGGDHKLTPEAMLGASAIHWHITKNQTLSLTNTFYPALDNLGQFRNILDAGWKVKIDQADGLSLKLGLQDQYDSRVTGGDKHNDLKYYGAVVYDF